MKTAAIASAVFVAAAAAQPRGHGHQHKHAARAMVTETEWVTEVQYVTELVDATTTLWITPGQEPAPTPTPTSTIKANFFEPPSSAPQAPPTSAAAPPPPPPPPPQPSTTSSVYTPPPPPPPPPAPTTTSSAYAPPPPPPPPPSSQQAPPQPSQQAPPSYAGSGSAIANKGPFNGQITYYDIGLGACGYNDAGLDYSESIVAIAVGMMGSMSNGNPYCNQTITIHANGKSTTATVRDKCMGCAVDDIDVSKKVYMDLWGSLDSGRMPVTWEIN
ncbi:Allergen Asp f 7 [Tolypocladium ophioglossoides CBS 100239]|uniref:Allergen Asp f 7 n=1 Tax=Tolypocladium ophioglossoides (strain CBS 100239) TaxID=1163406 RepID=A0A0L0MY24_TOLOC|nr:Allergen Asp f 7 [Tolypocladium ophioglossoides CBS 100239]